MFEYTEFTSDALAVQYAALPMLLSFIHAISCYVFLTNFLRETYYSVLNTFIVVFCLSFLNPCGYFCVPLVIIKKCYVLSTHCVCVCVCVCVLCVSQNKRRLLPYKALIDWFLGIYYEVKITPYEQSQML